MTEVAFVGVPAHERMEAMLQRLVHQGVTPSRDDRRQHRIISPMLGQVLP